MGLQQVEGRLSRGLWLHLRALFHPWRKKVVPGGTVGGKTLYVGSVSGPDALRLKGYSAKGPEIGYSMEEIAEIARQMIVETESNIPPRDIPIQPGFLASFWSYPKGAALA
jgi:hypothetical protein